MRSAITALLFLAIVVCATSLVKTAEVPQDGTPDIQPGDYLLIITDKAPLTLDGKVVAALPRNTTFIVDQIKGDLIGGFTMDLKSSAGWVKKSDVRPAITLVGSRPPAKTGRPIKWPAPLLDVRFAQFRDIVESPFLRKQESGRPIEDDDYRRIIRASRDLSETLSQGKIVKLAPDDLKVAQSFLDGLGNEAQSRLRSAPVKGPSVATATKPTSGSIKWPSILLDKRFAESRDRIEKPIRDYRTTQKIPTERDYLDMISEVSRIRAELEHDADAIPPADYRRALDFLDRLRQEAGGKIRQAEKK